MPGNPILHPTRPSNMTQICELGLPISGLHSRKILIFQRDDRFEPSSRFITLSACPCVISFDPGVVGGRGKEGPRHRAGKSSQAPHVALHQFLELRTFGAVAVLRSPGAATETGAGTIALQSNRAMLPQSRQNPRIAPTEGRFGATTPTPE
jgi:hypothetical protein